MRGIPAWAAKTLAGGLIDSHCDEYCPRCSNTSATACSRTSCRAVQSSIRRTVSFMVLNRRWSSGATAVSGVERAVTATSISGVDEGGPVPCHYSKLAR